MRNKKWRIMKKNVFWSILFCVGIFIFGCSRAKSTRRLFEKFPNGILIIGEQQKYVFWNYGFLKDCIINASNDTLVLYAQRYGSMFPDFVSGQSIIKVLMPGNSVKAKANFLFCTPPDSITVSKYDLTVTYNVLLPISQIPEENSLGSNIMLVRSRSKQEIVSCYPWKQFETAYRDKTIRFQPEPNKEYMVNLMNEPICIVQSSLAFPFSVNNMKLLKTIPAGGYAQASLSKRNYPGTTSSIVTLSALPKALKQEAQRYLDSLDK